MWYGIDFGTSNSVVAIFDGEKVSLLPINPEGVEKTVLQSVIYTRKSGERFIGQEAIGSYLQDNLTRKPIKLKKIYFGEEMIFWIPEGEGLVKRIGRMSYELDVNKPGQLLQAFKTALREGFEGEIDLFEKKFELEELIGMILSYMKKMADQYLGKEVKNVVLGRPVHYQEEKKLDKKIEDRMKKAAKLAGFKKIKFLPEPVAAAYSYLGKDKDYKGTIFVFDFGGGTLDFSLVRKLKPKVEIVATEGLAIGGDLFNEEIMEKKISKHFGVDLKWGPKRLPMPHYIQKVLRNWYEVQTLNSYAMRDFLKRVKQEVNGEEKPLVKNLESLVNYDLAYELFEEIERAKIALSEKEKAEVVFDKQGIKFKEVITQKEFESFIDPYLKKIEKTILKMFKIVRLSEKKIDRVVCTGGVSYTPCVQKLLAKIFEKKKIEIHDAFTGVGAGLAIAAKEY